MREGLDPSAVAGGSRPRLRQPQSPRAHRRQHRRRQRRRRALLARARRDDFVILEDDYDVEMRLGATAEPGAEGGGSRRPGALRWEAIRNRLFPGLRLGCLVAPAPFIEAAAALRSVVLRHPPGVTQRAAAHFLALGHYNAHLQRQRRVLDERRSIASEALLAAGFHIASPRDAGGSSLWVAAPDGLDSDTLAARARDRGVLIEPGAVFFADLAPTPYFRMAISSIASDRIAEGVRRLADCL